MAKNKADEALAAAEALNEKLHESDSERDAGATGTTGATNKKKGPSSKEARGVDPSLVTSWVAWDSRPEDNEIVHHAAKFRKISVPELLRPILQAALMDAWESIKADAERYQPSGNSIPIKAYEDMTPEELEAELARVERQVAKYEEAKERAVKIRQTRETSEAS